MRPGTNDTYRDRLLRVLTYIEQHLDEDLSVERLAAVAHFSPFHFHRIFRGMLGEPLMEYVRRLRHQRAAHALKFSAEPVTSLALAAGYDSPDGFTRAFRSAYGSPPSTFRRQRRPEPPDGEPLAVRVEVGPALRLAFVRHLGPYAQVGRAWHKLMHWASADARLRGTFTTLGIVHDDPDVTPPDKVRYDACIQIPARVEPQGEIGLAHLPAGTYAVTTHRGPYDTLGRTYARLCGQWLASTGHELRHAPAFERYLNHPQQTSPRDLLTDIHLPLKG